MRGIVNLYQLVTSRDTYRGTRYGDVGWSWARKGDTNMTQLKLTPENTLRRPGRIRGREEAHRRSNCRNQTTIAWWPTSASQSD
jgi:hypothetical protein